MNDPDENIESHSIKERKTELELQRLRFERQKHAIEAMIKKREFHQKGKNTFKEAFSSPLMLAIAGGLITLMTSIISNYHTASENRRSESQKFRSELIKSFITINDEGKVRGNLEFLVDSGLIEDPGNKIKDYVADKKKPLPVIAAAGNVPAYYSPCPILRVRRKDENSKVGVSLHIASARLDPAVYEGASNYNFDGTIPDMIGMANFSSALGYQANILTDTMARSGCLFDALKRLARELKSGDTLMLTISGSGMQTDDKSGSEPDRRQEEWVLYDRTVAGSEVSRAFASFDAGVLIVVVQDLDNASPLRHQGGLDVEADVLVFAGTEENQYAWESSGQGDFTNAFLDVWNDGEFQGSYSMFMAEISKRLAVQNRQTPRLYIYSRNPQKIQNMRPFVIGQVQ